MSGLDDRLLAAHASDDRRALVALYQEAAAGAETLDAAGFYLVHAYVFALETGHPDADLIRATLAAQGREAQAVASPAGTVTGSSISSR